MSHERVPDFNELNDILRAHRLANRRGEWFGPRGCFSIIWPTAVSPAPCGCVALNKWITCRSRTAFYDVFGRVPLLINPVFADYMQAYGEGGLKAERLQVLPMLARLYWYTVEFG